MRALVIGLRRWLRPNAPATCAEVARILQPYLDGDLEEATLRRVAEHLEVCRRCGLEAETYRALKEAVARRVAPADDSLARLRSFAERVARGEFADQ